MAAILTNRVLKHGAHLSAAVGAGALQGLWEHKGSRCTPPMPRIVRPGGCQHRLELVLTQRPTPQHLQTTATPTASHHSAPVSEPEQVTARTTAPRHWLLRLGNLPPREAHLA